MHSCECEGMYKGQQYALVLFIAISEVFADLGKVSKEKKHDDRVNTGRVNNRVHRVSLRYLPLVKEPMHTPQ